MAESAAVIGKVPKKRPQPKGGSRKGVPNKVTKELKDMILGALDKSGGVDYLQERANDPKTASAFLTLLGKVLPLQVTGEGGGAVIVEIVRFSDAANLHVHTNLAPIPAQQNKAKSNSFNV